MNLISMDIYELIAYIKSKPKIDEFIEQVEIEPLFLEKMIEIIKLNRKSEKYFCDKVIRMTSERNPLLVYPYFDDMVQLMNSSNHFIKWGSIITLSNLISVDDKFKFESIYETYFDLINSDSMITACNVIKQSWRFVHMHKEFDDDMTKRLLQVKDNIYYYQEQISPECKSLVIGAVIDSFSNYFEISNKKKDMLAFVKSETTNQRPSVAKKAIKFLEKHTK